MIYVSMNTYKFVFVLLILSAYLCSIVPVYAQQGETGDSATGEGDDEGDDTYDNPGEEDDQSDDNDTSSDDGSDSGDESSDEEDTDGSGDESDEQNDYDDLNDDEEAGDESDNQNEDDSSESGDEQPSDEEDTDGSGDESDDQNDEDNSNTEDASDNEDDSSESGDEQSSYEEGADGSGDDSDDQNDEDNSNTEDASDNEDDSSESGDEQSSDEEDADGSDDESDNQNDEDNSNDDEEAGDGSDSEDESPAEEKNSMQDDEETNDNPIGDGSELPRSLGIMSDPVPVCSGADLIIDVSTWVVGDGCHNSNRIEDSIVVNIPRAGRHVVEGMVHRGYPEQCQTNEDFYLIINGESGPETEDDADPCASSDRIDYLGVFDFKGEDTEIVMHTAALCPPDEHANSVSLEYICIYYGSGSFCGDGVKDDGEECDDGNGNDYDGCMNDCTLRMTQVPIHTCTGDGDLYLYKGDPFQDIYTSFVVYRDEVLIFAFANVDFSVEVDGVSVTPEIVADVVEPHHKMVYSVRTSYGSIVSIEGDEEWGARLIHGYLAQDSSNPVYDIGNLQVIYDDQRSNDMYLISGTYSYVFFDKYSVNTPGNSADTRPLHVTVDGPFGVIHDKTYTQPEPSPSEGVVVGTFSVAGGQAGQYTLSVDTEDSIYWAFVDCPRCYQRSERNIIVRSDDIGPWWSLDSAIYLTEYLKNRNIPQTLGVVPITGGGTVNLEEDSRLVDYLLSIRNDPDIEFGVHGLEHSYNEFLGISQSDAEGKIDQSMQMITDSLHVKPVTFIPPYYAYDKNALFAARSQGMEYFSAGWNAIDMGHGFSNYPSGLWNIPVTTDVYNWGTGSFYSAGEIEASCENAMNWFGTCVIVLHHHQFVDEEGKIDPSKIALLDELTDWIKDKESAGVGLDTIGKHEVVGDTPDPDDILDPEDVPDSEDKYIVFRSDDFGPFWSVESAIRVTETLREKDIPQVLSVVPKNQYGNKLSDDPVISDYLRAISVDPSIEFALHGYIHSDHEFRDVSYSDADSWVGLGLSILEGVVGDNVVTFVPPYHEYNENTLSALEANNMNIISSGYGDYVNGLAFTRDEYGIMHLPAIVEFYNWGEGRANTAQDIESSCQYALNNYDVCIIMLHHHMFKDDSGDMDSAKVDVLRDVADWAKNKEDMGDVKIVRMKDISGGVVTVIPQTDWELLYVDSEEINVDPRPATNAFDGDESTIWHTEWRETDPEHPHEIQINLGKDYDISGFRYMPRPMIDGGYENGRIKGYEFYVSSNGIDWGTPVANGVFDNTGTEKEVLFTKKTGRYIRLVALSEVNDGAWTSMAELNVLGVEVVDENPTCEEINWDDQLPECINDLNDNSSIVKLIANQSNRNKIQKDICSVEEKVRILLDKDFTISYCKSPATSVGCIIDITVSKEGNQIKKKTVIETQNSVEELELTEEEFIEEFTPLNFLNDAFEYVYLNCSSYYWSYGYPIPMVNPNHYHGGTGDILSFNDAGLINERYWGGGHGQQYIILLNYSYL